MANFYTLLMIAKKNAEDLIYFVEDDYLHKKDAIKEMIFAYEKFSTIFSKDEFLYVHLIIYFVKK